jgi:outer membrane protein assembly factor BamB
LLASCVPLLLHAGDNWPEFRGPHGDGVSKARGLPTSWGEKENVAWKTAIHGKAWSSPVIWGDQVWMTTAPADGKQLYAVCVDKNSGKILHDVKVFDVEKPAFCIPYNSYASCTPAVEEGRLYAHFGSAGTACLDTATGKKLWERRDLKCDHFRGPGSSAILYRGLLILTFDGFDLNYLVALDKTTGKTVWKADRKARYSTDNGDYHKAYSTPAVIDVKGTPLLVSPGAEYTMAFEPLTGKEVWRVQHGGMNVSSRPVYDGERLYLTSGHNGKLLAVRPEGKGDLTKTGVDWTYGKAVPTRPSLLLSGGLIFMVSDQGMASCVDAKDGKLVKQQRLGGGFSASPVLADGKLYFANDKGTTYVVEANRGMKVLAENRLDEGCMASPAVSGRAIFLRTRTHLYRIEQN